MDRVPAASPAGWRAAALRRHSMPRARHGIDQSQLYGSKTGVQGEADAILMIGNTYEIDTRFIHVAKNKLPGGPRTKPAERHGKFEVRFDGERARYASKFY